MDGTLKTEPWSSGEVATRLGVSVPTVRRVGAQLGLSGGRTGGGHRRFSSDDMRRLAARLGTTPQVKGLSAAEVKVLAAVARQPFGFRSVRAVARASRIAPTTATSALTKLGQLGMVSACTETVAEGSAREVTVYRLRPGEDWAQLASVVLQVTTPESDDQPPSVTRVPQLLWHHFWNVDPAQLRLPTDEQFVARRLLLGDDPIAWAWAARNLSTAAITSARTARGVDAPTVALIDNLVASR